MQNYQGSSGNYIRRGNQGRYSRNDSCQPVVTASSCVCDKAEEISEPGDALSGFALAMAYVPWQTWRKIMCPEKALKTGTIFEELYKPFLGMGGC